MARILSRALHSIRGLYSFTGQRTAPDAIEVDLPVQMVHDVSSGALQQRMIRFVNQISTTGVGAGTDRTQFNPYTQAVADGLIENPGSWDCYIVHYHTETLAASEALITATFCGLTQGAEPGVDGYTRLLFSEAGPGLVQLISGSSFMMTPNLAFGVPQYVNHRSNSQVRLAATVTGAATVQHFVHMVFVPAGYLTPTTNQFAV